MRIRAFRLAALLLSCLGAVACGSNVVTGTGASGTGGTGTTAPTGDCTSDAQCSPGQCVPLTPGGYKVCTHMPPEATTCANMGLDQCCTTADCKGKGKCYATTSLPYCGGPAMAAYNLCLADECTDDASCAATGPAQAICAPAGVNGTPVKACFKAYCHTSADCTAHAGGACVPVRQSCCGGLGGLACVYPGGCAKDADCGQSNHCQIDDASGAGVCITGPASCPV